MQNFSYVLSNDQVILQLDSKSKISSFLLKYVLLIRITYFAFKK